MGNARKDNCLQADSILSNFFIDTPEVLKSEKRENSSESLALEQGLISLSSERGDINTGNMVTLLQRHERGNFPEKDFFLSEKMDFSQISMGELQSEKLRAFLGDVRQMGGFVAVKHFWEGEREERGEGGDIQIEENKVETEKRVAEVVVGGVTEENKVEEMPTGEVIQKIEEESQVVNEKVEGEAAIQEETQPDPVKIETEENGNEAPEVKDKEPKIETERPKEDKEATGSRIIEINGKEPAPAQTKPAVVEPEIENAPASDDKESIPLSQQITPEEQIDEDFHRMLAQSTTDINPNKKLCQPTTIAFSSPLPLLSRSFFGSHHFYNFFSFFTVLFERLKLAKTKSQKPESYEFFKQVLALRIAGALDSSVFDDILSCLFGDLCGVFMNFEKILTGVAKEVPAQELDQFIIGLNAPLFRPEGRAVRVYPSGRNGQSEIFVKTCYKIGSSSGRNRQNFKHAQSLGRQDGKGEDDFLLKFEYRSDHCAFVVHKVRSIYKNGMKQVGFVLL